MLFCKVSWMVVDDQDVAVAESVTDTDPFLAMTNIRPKKGRYPTGQVRVMIGPSVCAGSSVLLLHWVPVQRSLG